MCPRLLREDCTLPGHKPNLESSEHIDRDDQSVFVIPLLGCVVIKMPYDVV